MGSSSYMMGRPATVAVSTRTAWLLSALIIFAAVMPNVLKLGGQRIDFVNKAPTFAGFRDPAQGNEFFYRNRLTAAPLHYGLFHLVPSIVWGVLMPFQHSDSFRRNNPPLHRAFGYVIAATSVLLAITGVAFPIRKRLGGANISYSHPDILHIYTLRRADGRLLLAWPTFDVALMLLFPIQLYTIVRAVRAAQAQKYAEHRTFAVAYTISGYSIGLQRVGMAAQALFGTALAFVPPKMQKSLGIPSSGTAQAEADMAAFALFTWVFAASGYLVWTAWVFLTGKAVWSEKRPAVPPASKGGERTNGSADSAPKFNRRYKRSQKDE